MLRFFCAGGGVYFARRKHISENKFMCWVHGGMPHVVSHLTKSLPAGSLQVFFVNVFARFSDAAGQTLTSQTNPSSNAPEIKSLSLMKAVKGSQGAVKGAVKGQSKDKGQSRGSQGQSRGSQGQSRGSQGQPRGSQRTVKGSQWEVKVSLSGETWRESNIAISIYKLVMNVHNWSSQDSGSALQSSALPLPPSYY